MLCQKVELLLTLNGDSGVIHLRSSQLFEVLEFSAVRRWSSEDDELYCWCRSKISQMALLDIAAGCGFLNQACCSSFLADNLFYLSRVRAERKKLSASKE